MYPFPFLEAAYMAKMSESSTPTYTDPRIAKLTDNKAYPPLWVCGIEDGWNIRVKIASDIDNARVYKFGDRHHGIQHYSEWWTIYYCVYHNDDFKFAACKNPFYMKYWEDYQNLDVPNRLYAIYSYSDFLISEGSLSFNSSTGLSVNVEGTFIQSTTRYSWTNDVDRIEGETTSSTGTFSDSYSDFFGKQFNGYYIINGNGDDFGNAVHGLYAACLKRI